MTELRINFWPHTKKIEDDKQGVEQEEDGDDDAYSLLIINRICPHNGVSCE